MTIEGIRFDLNQTEMEYIISMYNQKGNCTNIGCTECPLFEIVPCDNQDNVYSICKDILYQKTLEII
jgi:hypothetical protein